MRSIYMLSADICCKWFELPVQKWKLTLDLSFDVTYPFIRYKNADSEWRGKNSGAGHLACSKRARAHTTAVLFMNPTRRSVMLYTLSPDDLNEHLNTPARELEESGWAPGCSLLHEFSVARLVDENTDKYTRVGSIDEAIEVSVAVE